MSKRYKEKQCVYCVDRLSVEPDHVFAREFFLEEHRANLPKAPACRKCNADKSLLEHYLTAVLPFGGRHADSARTLEEMVPSRLAKNARLHRTIAAKYRRAWSNENGVLIPTGATPLDVERLLRLFNFIARGLAHVHFGLSLTQQDFVCSYALTPARDARWDALMGLPAANHVSKDFGSGTVTYEGHQAGDLPEITVWRVSMYGGMRFGEPARPDTLCSAIGMLTGPESARISAELEARWRP